MKVLITGADGQLGWVLQRNKPDDWDIVALNRKDLDITDAFAVKGVLKKHQPDLVINTAAYTAVDKAESEKDKAYENLRIYSQIPVPHLRLILRIERDPLFDSIRDEPEFQQIVKDVEAKYQAENERVRQWLEENNML